MLGPKIFLAYFVSFFVYALLHFMSYMPQDFTKWKWHVSSVSVASFISIAFVVVKLKISKVFCIDSTSNEMALFWALAPPNIVQSCWNFDQRLSVSNKTNRVFEKSFKILNFSLNGRHPKFTVLFHFGAQCTAGKP